MPRINVDNIIPYVFTCSIRDSTNILNKLDNTFKITKAYTGLQDIIEEMH